MKRISLLTVASLLVATPTFAMDTMSKDSMASSALASGNSWLKLRYRYENVEQDGVANDANASTAKFMAGYETGDMNGFKVLGEIEGAGVIGKDRYNSLNNGKTNYPTVADPEFVEVNRLQLTYNGIENMKFTLGRQNIKFDNQRYIGTIGYRQNNQSFDAARVDADLTDNLKATYVYLDGVQRLVGNDNSANGDHKHNSHLVNVSYDAGEMGKVTGYAYLLDNEDSAVNSSNTFGVRYTNKFDVAENTKAHIAAEFANQKDAADNTNDYSENYMNLEGKVAYKPYTFTLGYESLGGTGTAGESFRTSLATGHKFNGWTDKFLTTPDNGLEDVYVKASAKLGKFHPLLKKTKVKVAYHDFSAENGGADYGSEWNAAISKQFNKNYFAVLKYADYDADTYSADTQKVALTINAKF